MLSIDNYHEECFHAGNCKNYGESICPYCGVRQPGNEVMYCCSKSFSYSPSHRCSYALFRRSSSADFQCVTTSKLESNQNFVCFFSSAMDSPMKKNRTKNF